MSSQRLSSSLKPVPPRLAYGLAVAAIAGFGFGFALWCSFYSKDGELKIYGRVVIAMIFVGPFLLLAAASLRRRASCLAWGLNFAAFAVAFGANVILFQLVNQQSIGTLGISLVVLASEYLAAVGAVVLGLGVDWWNRKSPAT